MVACWSGDSGWSAVPVIEAGPTRRHLPTRASIEHAVWQLVRAMVEELRRDGLPSSAKRRRTTTLHRTRSFLTLTQINGSLYGLEHQPYHTLE